MRILALFLILSSPAWAVNFPVAPDAKFVQYDTLLPGCVLNTDPCLFKKNGKVYTFLWPDIDRTTLVDSLPANVTYLEYIVADKPLLGVDEKYSTPVWTIDRIGAFYTKSWAAIPMTAQEIIDRDAAQQELTNRQVCREAKAGIKADIQAFKNSTGNMATFRALVEKWMPPLMRCQWPNQTGAN